MPTNENQQDTGVEETDEAHDPEAIAAESVGDILRAERLRQELTEKEVADQLHITMHYVRAIESNSFEKLPGAVFVKGYIKSYALFLGLEESQVIGSYNVYVSEQQDAAREKTRIQVRRRKDKNRPWVIGSAIAFVSLFLILWFFNSGTEQIVEPDTQESSQFESQGRVETMPAGGNQEVVVAPVLAESMPASLIGSSSEVPSQNFETPLKNTEIAAQLTGLADLVESGELDDPESPLVFEEIGLVNQAGSLEQNETQTTLQPAQQSTPPLQTTIPSGATESSAAVVNGEAAVLLETADLAGSEDTEGRILIESEGSDLLLIALSGDSWLEVSDGFDNLLFLDLTKAGDMLEIKGTGPFDILIGDAPVAKMTLNGVDVDVSKNTRADNSARLTVGL